MGKRIAQMGGLALSLSLLVPTAKAAVTANYLGSLKLGTAAGYYSDAMTILPNGYPREPGDPVAGPTLVTVGYHTDGDNVAEWTIPALSKTAAGLQTASTVSPTLNGTQVIDTRARYQTFDSLTTFNGKIWAQNGAALNNFSTQLVAFDAGISETWTSSSGGSSIVYGFGTSLPAGSTYGTHTGYGIAPKRDESKVLLTTRMTTGSNVIHVLRGTWDAGSGSFLNQANVFDFTGVNQQYNLEYINISGQWYYALTAQQTQTFTLLLFNAATTGSNATPEYTFTLSSSIAGGTGWWYSNSQIKDLAWDEQNKILYALDTAYSGGSKGGYVHAFTFVPEPATLVLVALGGVALLRRLC